MIHHQHDLSSINAHHTLPTFHKGQQVQVILNRRNTTPHTGLIHEIYWHRARRKFYYRIKENDRIITKRYYSDDLRSIE